MAPRLDPFDIQLLQALQTNNQRTAAELAASVALSPSAIHRRLKRLRDVGAIERDVAILSPSLVGGRLTALVSVQLREQTTGVVTVVRQALVAQPEVQMCFEITGPFDLCLVIVERSMDRLTALTEELLSNSPHVRRYETSLVRRRLKATLAIPLGPEDATAEA